MNNTLFTTTNIVLLITATCTALIAGLFYAYSCSVMLALGRLPNAEFISAMQSINRAIQNPVFFISFMGTLVALPVSTYLNYSQPLTLRFYFLLAATIIYFVGVFAVTVFGNIPLNDALEAFKLSSATPEAITLQRTAFEKSWNFLNTIRTISSLLAIIFVIIACINPKSIFAIVD